MYNLSKWNFRRRLLLHMIHLRFRLMRLSTLHSNFQIHNNSVSFNLLINILDIYTKIFNNKFHHKIYLMQHLTSKHFILKSFTIHYFSRNTLFTNNVTSKYHTKIPIPRMFINNVLLQKYQK